MADLNLHAEIIQSSPGAQGIAEGQSLTVYRPMFVREETPGMDIDKKKMSVKEGPVKGKESTIRKEVVEGLRNYLTDYMFNLSELRKQNPQLLDQPGHEYEAMAWKVMGDEDRQTQEAKVAKFLGSTSGLKFATLLLEQQASRKLQMIGLYASTNKPGERDETIDEGVTRTGEGQGAANKFWYDKINPQLQKIHPRTHPWKFSAVVSSTLAGAMSGLELGPHTDGYFGMIRNATIGGIAGFSTAVGVGAAAEQMAQLFRSGYTFDMRRTVNALDAIKSDPQEVEYLKRMYGIDLDGFDVDVTHQIVRLAPGAERQRLGGLRDEALSALKLRNEFYKDLGVPVESMDSMPELYLYEHDRVNGPEQISSRIQERVQQILEADASYDPNNRTNLATNLEAVRNARSQVMVELASEYIQNERDRKDLNKVRPLDALTTKLNDYSIEGSRVTERREPLLKEKTALEAVKIRLQDEAVRLTNFNTIAAEIERLNDNARVEFASIPGVDLDAKIAHVRALLNKDLVHPTGVSIEEQIAAIPTYRVREIVARVGALTIPAGKGRDAAEANIVKQVHAEADALKEALEKDERKWSEKITKLEKAKLDIETQQQLLDESVSAVVERDRVFKDLADAYSTVSLWTITDDELRTLDLNALLDRINTLNQATPARGWPKEKNGELNNRTLLMHAVIQLKAEDRANKDGARGTRLPDYTDIVSWGITDTQLRRHSKDELLKLINDEYIRSGGANGWDTTGNTPANEAKVMHAIAEAKQRCTVRSDEYEAIIKTVDKAVSAKQEEIEKIEVVGKYDRVLVTKDLLSHQERAFKRTKTVMFGSEEGINAFTDLSLFAASDAPSLTDSENKFRSVAPKGYFELIDILFDYKQRPDRDAYFKKVAAVLPPKRMAELLNQGLDLGLPSPYGNRMDYVLAELHTQIDSHTIEARQMRRAFVSIMDRLQEEALALS